MDNKEARNYQLGYLKNILPDGFSFESDSSVMERLYPADGVIYYSNLPCAIVMVRLMSYDDDLEQMKQLMRQSDLPYSVLYIKDSWRIMQRNEDDGFEDFTDLEDFFKKIDKTSHEPDFTDEEIETFITSLHDLAQNTQIPDEAKKLIMGVDKNTIRKELITPPFELSCSFNPSFEQELFVSLVGSFTDETLCRYTTLDGLFRILSTKNASMCSITCMNDKSECYYVDKYLDEDYNIQISQLGNDKVVELNRYFILSCSISQLQDTLFMWRMYGDEAKGICIKYKVNSSILNSKFQLAKVSYAIEEGVHPELDFIRECTKFKIHGRRLRLKTLPFWKHFFKPHTYKEEKEVRLLYYASAEDSYKWIKTGDNIVCPVVEFDISSGHNLFPLVLNGIILGPKFPEVDTNASQIRLFKDQQQIEEDTDKSVSFSRINNYR